MSEIARIVSAEPVIQGVLKIVWDDDYQGVVDLRPVLAKGRIYTYLADPHHFAALRVGEDGHAVIWTNDKGQTIDFGALSLREKAEMQAELIRLAG